MTVVITVAQQKGGAGKTTLAANLAAAFSADRKVALLDIDPQKTLTRWHALRAARTAAAPVAPVIDFVDVAGWRLASELEKLKRAHDVVIVDSPPQLEMDAKVAIRGADLVIVPVQPSPPDLWAAEGTLKLAAAERRQARIMLTRAPAASKLRTAVEQEIAARAYPLLAASLGNRIGFAVAFAQGLGITETAPRSIAAGELLAVLAEIKGILG